MLMYAPRVCVESVLLIMHSFSIIEICISEQSAEGEAQDDEETAGNHSETDQHSPVETEALSAKLQHR